MKLSRIGANQTCINHNNGTEVFFSYDTPVAVKLPNYEYLKTNVKYSVTTTKHINKWLDGVNAEEVSQDVINNLAEGNDYIKYTDEEKELTTLEELSNQAYSEDMLALDEQTYKELTELASTDWGKSHLEYVMFGNTL
jgi:hypothetical protein